ncbi:unnamed protein product, partial [Trichobilharzia regenti]
PKKNKSSSKSRGGRSSRKSTSKQSNGQFKLNNELLQHLDELDDDTIESVGRDYYLFIIKQLETQVTAYENYIKELSLQNEELTTKLHLTDTQCRDNFMQLNQIFQSRINESADLIERIQSLKCVYRTNVEKWKARENELHVLKKSTEERMTAENLALGRIISFLMIVKI